MAPTKTRSLSRKSLPNICGSPGKENQFLRSVNDFQARVRRRESLRSIKHSIKEFDLEQKIELEIKMREGTTKLLAASRHQTQQLEAAKSLLTSNERMSAYIAELQRRKRGDVTMPPPKRHAPPVSTLPPSKARLCFSELRMPLMWRDSDHFKNKGDYRRFAVFCLARAGTEVYDTSLLCPVDRSLTDLTFPDVIVFNQVPHDFVFQLEIFGHMLRDDLSIASTPRKIKNTIHSSISRTVGKKLAASLRDELNSGKIGPHFHLMASARLTLEHVHDSTRTHDLKLESFEVRSHQLPLFGHFCCRLAAQPDCMRQPIVSGPLSLLSHQPQLQQPLTWAQLQAWRLHLWRDRDAWLMQGGGSGGEVEVVIDKETVIRARKSSNCELEVSNECEGKEVVSVLRATSMEERDKWLRLLVHHALDHQRWRLAAERVMEIQTPGAGKNSFTKPFRQGSLYDETPLIETIEHTRNSCNEYTTSRPTVHEIFGLTPSTSLSSCSSSSSPTFRDRSLSSSGSSKSRSFLSAFSRSHND
ncbi:rhotekin isoform X2 [Nilaparvata lugens]|uniref:rhotekin isoform X2 n=1 Tax=Nilaparvata lugens TaxID=108931 RepID=UPI00193C9C93|nr:rhotekin isoform X2 [Nilaparvata lugens]